MKRNNRGRGKKITTCSLSSESKQKERSKESCWDKTEQPERTGFKVEQGDEQTMAWWKLTVAGEDKKNEVK